MLDKEFGILDIVQVPSSALLNPLFYKGFGNRSFENNQKSNQNNQGREKQRGKLDGSICLCFRQTSAVMHLFFLFWDKED